MVLEGVSAAGMPEAASSVSGVPLPKLQWRPQEQWRKAGADVNLEGLTGKAPLAGLFSGFWPSACLLPDVAAKALNDAPGPEVPSINFFELAGDEEFFETSPLPGSAAPVPEATHASEEKPSPSEQQKAAGSPADGMHKAAKDEAAPPVKSMKRGSEEMPREAASAPAQKRRREDDHADGASKMKERLRGDSRDRSHDRSTSREPWRSERYKEDRYERSSSREPSAARRQAGHAQRDSRDRDSWDAHPSARSQSRLAGRKDEVWPFRRGRIIPCSTSMSKEMLRELKFGSDVREDLEDLSPGTAGFLWDYQKQRMHGIFAGTTKPIEDTPRDTPYLYEVEVDNYKDYRSLPKELALRLVPKNGRTRRGETLLKPYLDAEHTERLCSAFAKQHRSPTH